MKLFLIFGLVICSLQALSATTYPICFKVEDVSDYHNFHSKNSEYQLKVTKDHVYFVDRKTGKSHFTLQYDQPALDADQGALSIYAYIPGGPELDLVIYSHDAKYKKYWSRFGIPNNDYILSGTDSFIYEIAHDLVPEKCGSKD